MHGCGEGEGLLVAAAVGAAGKGEELAGKKRDLLPSLVGADMVLALGFPIGAAD